MRWTNACLFTIPQRQIRKVIDTSSGSNICCSAAKRRLQDTRPKTIDQVEAKLRSQKVADKMVSYYQDHFRVLPNKKKIEVGKCPL